MQIISGGLQGWQIEFRSATPEGVADWIKAVVRSFGSNKVGLRSKIKLAAEASFLLRMTGGECHLLSPETRRAWFQIAEEHRLLGK